MNDAKFQAYTSTEAQANPPGREALSWRTGTYDQFVKQMRHLIHTLSVDRGFGRPHQPLAQMDTRVEPGRSGGTDFGLALIEAWAVVCDVLAFYGERIANETYLGTAMEDRSIRELIHMIGYRPHPGLAAETFLSFTVAETRGAPKQARIPKNTMVESVPGQDEESQIFQTSEELEARTAYNRFKPWLPSITVSYPLHCDSELIRLGPSTNRPKSGDPLLLIASREKDSGRESIFFARKIAVVDADSEQMVLGLTSQPTPTGHYALHDPRLYTFGRSSALFGNQAPLWQDVSESVRRSIFPKEGGMYVGDASGNQWRRVTGLLDGDIRCMLVTEDGIFAAVAGAGLFRSQDEGRHWQPLRAGLNVLDLQCLAADNRGHIYAGSADGMIFRSKNGGESFTALRGKVAMVGKGLFAETRDTSMPQVAVTSLFLVRGDLRRPVLKHLEKQLDISSVLALLNPGTYFKLASKMMSNSAKLLGFLLELLKKIFQAVRKQLARSLSNTKAEESETRSSSLAQIIFVGTETGIFRSIPGGWEAAGKGLPGYDEETGTALVLVNAFASAEEYLLAATDQGIFRSDNFGDTWKGCNRGLPHRDATTGTADLKILCLTTTVLASGETVLLAGTAFGVFRSVDAGSNWVEANQDLPLRAMQKGPAQLLVRHLATAVGGDPGRIFAATDNGLFYSGSSGLHWEPRNQHLRHSRIKLPNENYGESLDRGILPPKLRAAFKEAGMGLTLFAYPIIEERGNAWTIPDEPRAGVYHLAREGRWIKISSRITDILAMAMMPDGGLVVGTPICEYEEDEWPHLWIESNRIDLAVREPEISAGGLLMLVQDDMAEYYTIREVSTVNRRDFTLRATVTRLTVDHVRGLERFDLRRVQAFFSSQKRELARIVQPDLRPIKGVSITIEGGDHEIPAGRNLLITGKCARARIGRVGGIFSLEGYGCANVGLSLRDIFVLATDSRMRVLAGTSHGLWRYDGKTFGCLGLDTHQIEHLVVEHALDEIMVSIRKSFEGVYLFRYRRGRWEPLITPGAVEGLTMRHTPYGEGHNTKGCVYLISQGLLWFSRDHGDRFQLLGSGLEGMKPTCIAVDEKRGFLYVGTSREGIFRLSPEGTYWEPFNEGLENLRINCLYVSAQTGQIFAGTQEGLFRNEGPDTAWVSLRRQLRVPFVTAILHHMSQLIIGTRGGGVFTRWDSERHWHEHPWGISNHISSLCIATEGHILVGTHAHTLLSATGDRELLLKHQALFQVRPHPQLAPESFRTTLQNDFSLAKMELSKDATLEHSVHETDAWVIRDGKIRFLLYRSEDALLVLYPSSAIKLIRAKRNLSEHHALWTLESYSALQAELHAMTQEMVYEPAPEEDAVVGESAVLAESKANREGGTTEFRFNRPLRLAYDRYSVTVLGNIARANHGKNHSEVIGSGEGALANQRFKLRGRDLTYMMSDDGPVSSLSIMVNPDQRGNGVVWQELASLYPSESATRGFATYRDGLNRVNLIFGDGQDGARLPTGEDNVVASYRIGMGEKGNLRSGTLRELPAAPLGVRAVDNPLPAGGGLDPEGPESSRHKAPIQVRTAGRILSLRDLSDYLMLYPDIDKVTARALWNGHNILGHVTVALRNKQQLTRDSDFFKNLMRTINHIKPKTFGAVQIDNYQPQGFNLELQLIVDPDHDMLQLEEEARALLLDHYGFAKAKFKRQINVPEMTHLIRSIEGIVAVEVLLLYAEGTVPMLMESLDSAEAYWDSDRREVIPARLLLAHPQAIVFQMNQLSGAQR